MLPAGRKGLFHKNKRKTTHVAVFGGLSILFTFNSYLVSAQTFSLYESIGFSQKKKKSTKAFPIWEPRGAPWAALSRQTPLCCSPFLYWIGIRKEACFGARCTCLCTTSCSSWQGQAGCSMLAGVPVSPPASLSLTQPRGSTRFSICL